MKEEIRPLISRVTLARMFGVSPQHVTSLVKKGKLNAIRIGKRIVFEEAEIERFINDNRIKGAY